MNEWAIQPKIIQEVIVDKTDEELMTDYGITSEPTSVYRYKEYKYSKLSDAVKYAKSESASEKVKMEESI